MQKPKNTLPWEKFVLPLHWKRRIIFSITPPIRAEAGYATGNEQAGRLLMSLLLFCGHTARNCLYRNFGTKKQAFLPDAENLYACLSILSALFPAVFLLFPFQSLLLSFKPPSLFCFFLCSLLCFPLPLLGPFKPFPAMFPGLGVIFNR